MKHTALSSLRNNPQARSLLYDRCLGIYAHIYSLDIELCAHTSHCHAHEEAMQPTNVSHGQPFCAQNDAREKNINGAHRRRLHVGVCIGYSTFVLVGDGEHVHLYLAGTPCSRARRIIFPSPGTEKSRGETLSAQSQPFLFIVLSLLISPP